MTEQMSVTGELGIRYRHSLLQKLEGLQAAWEGWVQDRDSVAAKQSFHTLVHRLAGSASIYGYLDLAYHARQIDHQLISWDEELKHVGQSLRDLCELLDGLVDGLFVALRKAAANNFREVKVGARTAAAREISVLLVEDDADQASAWESALSQKGMHVRTVKNGKALAAELALQVPDVLLIDYWLESDNGVELVKLLQDVSSFASIPKVCLTADTGPLPRYAAMGAGFAAVLRKSITSCDLADVLRQIIIEAERNH